MGDVWDITNKISRVINTMKKHVSVPREMTFVSWEVVAQAWEPWFRFQHPCRGQWCIESPRTAETETGRSLGFLSVLFSWFSEKPRCRKIKWKWTEEKSWYQLLASTYMHTHVHICTCTCPSTHTPPPTQGMYLSKSDTFIMVLFCILETSCNSNQGFHCKNNQVAFAPTINGSTPLSCSYQHPCRNAYTIIASPLRHKCLRNSCLEYQSLFLILIQFKLQWSLWHSQWENCASVLDEQNLCFCLASPVSLGEQPVGRWSLCFPLKRAKLNHLVNNTKWPSK